MSIDEYSPEAWAAEITATLIRAAHRGDMGTARQILDGMTEEARRDATTAVRRLATLAGGYERNLSQMAKDAVIQAGLHNHVRAVKILRDNDGKRLTLAQYKDHIHGAYLDMGYSPPWAKTTP